MKYVTVTYKDENRECGTIYYGVSAKAAEELFRQEFPQHQDRELLVKDHED